MSERLSDVERLTPSRFSDFVIGHADRAVRWEFIDSQAPAAFKFVEFAVLDSRGDLVDGDSPEADTYIMDLYLRLSPEQREEHGVRSAGILIEQASRQLVIIDDCEMVRPLVKSCYPDSYKEIRIAAVLMDRLLELEKAGTLIPAGRRVGSIPSKF